jgi:hypothetical protein
MELCISRSMVSRYVGILGLPKRRPRGAPVKANVMSIKLSDTLIGAVRRRAFETGMTNAAYVRRLIRRDAGVPEHA